MHPAPGMRTKWNVNGVIFGEIKMIKIFPLSLCSFYPSSTFIIRSLSLPHPPTRLPRLSLSQFEPHIFIDSNASTSAVGVATAATTSVLHSYRLRETPRCLARAALLLLSYAIPNTPNSLFRKSASMWLIKMLRWIGEKEREKTLNFFPFFFILETN